MPRARYFYRPQHPRANERGFVDAVDLADAPAGLARVPVVTDRYMEGVRALDAEGTDIGSRAKRREYMARHNYVDADDFRGEWAKAEKIRREGDPADRKARREAVGKAWHDVVEKRGKR